MPIFVLNTNLSKNRIPEEFLNETTELLAKLLGKDKYFFCVHVNPDQMLSYAGTDEPAAYVSLASIGKVGGDLNIKLAEALYQFLQDKLSLKSNRLCIEFRNLIGSEVAFEGRTLPEMK